MEHALSTNNYQSEEWYSPESELSADDQKYIWKLLCADSKKDTANNAEHNVIVNGSVNGGGKLSENTEKTLVKPTENDKLDSIKKCNYRTPPNKIATFLEQIFGVWDEKPGHWLYIAQYYTPKTINSVIYQMNKRQRRGEITLQKPGAYFTSVIKHKKKRKQFRNTTGSWKQH